MRLTGLVVGPPMLVEMAGALWLAFELPTGLPKWMPVLGLVLVLGVWASTALWSVPAHNGLLHGFDSDTHLRLCRTNLVRTLLWTARTLLVAAMVWHLVPKAAA